VGDVVMESTYYSPIKSGSYGGVQPLIPYSGQSHSNVTNWLSSQDVYTLHKPVRKVFPRRKTYAEGIHDLFQADLADMQQLSRFNDGYRFILTCVDVFSKRTFAIPLKDKKGSSVAAAFDKIFTEVKPSMIQTDRGTEFLNQQVQDVFRKNNTRFYFSQNKEIKAACVERFNRTLKTRLFRYFTHHRTNRWIDVLDEFIRSYNESFHRSIDMAPNDLTFDNADIIMKRLYPEKPISKWKCMIGDTVRISKYKNIFAFAVQVTIAYIVILMSLINITFTSENTCLWATLASATLGYLLPSPSFKNEPPPPPPLLRHVAER
jgi:hypothetical protein